MAKKKGFEKFFDQYKSYFKNPYNSATSSLEASKAPTTQRYQSLIDDIVRRQGVEEQDVTRNTNAELARRGITADSGTGAGQLTGALTNTRDKYGSLVSGANAEREQMLAQIQNLIADFKGRGESERMSNAMNLYQLKQSSGQSALENAFKLKQFNEYQLPYLKYQTGAPYYKPDSASTLSLKDIFGI